MKYSIVTANFKTFSFKIDNIWLYKLYKDSTTNFDSLKFYRILWILEKTNNKFIDLYGNNILKKKVTDWYADWNPQQMHFSIKTTFGIFWVCSIFSILFKKCCIRYFSIIQWYTILLFMLLVVLYFPCSFSDDFLMMVYRMFYFGFVFSYFAFVLWRKISYAELNALKKKMFILQEKHCHPWWVKKLFDF